MLLTSEIASKTFIFNQPALREAVILAVRIFI